jgi:alpha-D-ribose 1-methylphosphonate 5-triphosphate synthase subunit PhnG
VDETGRQHYLDATIAFKRAVLNCIDYLSKFGYTKRQARARPRSRLAAAVDVHHRNAACHAADLQR